MQVPLKIKINIGLLISFLVITVILLAIAYPFQKKQFESSQKRMELVLKTMVARDLEPLANEVFDNSVYSIKIRIKKMLEVDGMCRISVFDAKGKLLASEGMRPHTQNMTRYETETIGSAIQIKRVKLGEKDILHYVQNIKIMNENLGYIKLCFSLEQLKVEQNTSYLIFGSMLLSVFFVLMIVLNFILSKFIIKPIMHLRDAMEQIRSKEMGSQIAVVEKDEIGDLSKTFNQMSKELELSYGRIQLRNVELVQKEKEVDKVRLYLKNIIDSMPSILVGVNTRGIITQWNKKAEEITGILAERAKAKFFKDVLPWVKNLPINYIEEAINNRIIKQKTKIPVRIDNEKHYIDIVVYPLKGVGSDFEEAVMRIDDVTEHVRMEEMIIQSEKMLSVGGLAAGMAHEINNPLAGILQNISVIKNRLQKDLTPNKEAVESLGIDMDIIRSYGEIRDIPNLLNNVEKAGNRAATIVRDMLDFSRKGEGAFSSYDTAELLDETINLASTDYDLKKQFDFKKIVIERLYDTNLRSALCEKSKIQQVFFNILQNGAHAMMENIDIKPKFILRVKNLSDYIQVEIEDNGPGMNKEQSKRIFEPFYTTKPVGYGTGLGLSVSYFIITDNHKGNLSVESEPGKGTKFIIQIPAA
ncbi:MAG: HAMP domain-containing protein [Desulfobacteraceae bacterium]|nr:HAMP domain-containing protein [Desulfobacteraceae bacterium]